MGLLYAPAAALLLPMLKVLNDDLDKLEDSSKIQLEKIKKLLSDIGDGKIERIESEKKKVIDELAARKKKLNEQAGNI